MSTADMSGECMGEREPQKLATGERVSLVITNLVKLSGLVIVTVEVLARAEVRPSVLAVAGFMMAGAQGLESVLRGLTGR